MPGATPVEDDRCAAAASGPVLWQGDDAALARLAWRNAGRSLMSLGFYGFWGKVAWRRALWQSIRLDGKPLAYTGTVREALIPALVVLVAVMLAGAALGVMAWLGTPRPPAPKRSLRLAIAIPIVFLLGLSAWRSRSYLLSRTLIGDVPARLEGSPLAYALTHFATAFLVPLTLGAAIPWRQMWLQRRLVGSTVLGPHRLALGAYAPHRLLARLFAALAAGLIVYLGAVVAIAVMPLGRKISVWSTTGQAFLPDGADLALLLTLGLTAGLAIAAIAAWYRIGALRVLVGAVAFDGRALRLDVGTRPYLAASVMGALIAVVSLGLLSPLAELRRTRLLIEGLRYRDSK